METETQLLEYLKSMALSLETIKEKILADEEEIELDDDDEEDEEEEVELEESEEELVKEIVKFAKDNFEENPKIYNISDIFWENKGVTRYMTEGNLLLKIKKVESKAQIILDNEKKELEKKRFEQEKKELPKLIKNCVKFAEDNNLKKLTLSDLDTFILENDISVGKEIRKILYTKSNFQLKQRKIELEATQI